MTLKNLDISALKNRDITILNEPIRKKKKHDTTTFEYLYIGNIPSSYRSADLRFFFKDFVERKVFKCFHYRHRPEKQVIMKKNVMPNCQTVASSEIIEDDLSCSRDNKPGVPFSKYNKDDLTADKESFSTPNTNNVTCCCIINIYAEHTDQFIKTYNGKEWRNKDLAFAKRTVNIKRMNLKPKADDETAYKSIRDIKMDKHMDNQELYSEDLKCSIELNPPEYIMPNGNIGTTTKHFHGLIKECKMPASLIKSLALEFPKSKMSKVYSNVPPNYKEKSTKEKYSNHKKKYNDICVSPVDFAVHKSCDESESSQHEQRKRESNDDGKQFGNKSNCSDYKPSETKSRSDHKQFEDIPNTSKCKESDNQSDHSDKLVEIPGYLEEEDGAEDWERHETLHDDVDNQSRPKERLFEEDIELKWEKGGSGLVFYTDAYYWSELKGKDFDEDTVDDWDVDYSIYYEDGAGDKPARDQHEMRIEQRRREGKEEGPTKPSQLRRKEKRNRNQMNTNFAEFEKYSKGFGSRILKDQGWTEGSGVGSSREGIIEPLGHDGQGPNDRVGLGYYGEKLDRTVDLKRKVERDIHISTKYDEKDGEHMNAMRFHGLELLKYRSSSTVVKNNKKSS